MGIKEDLIRRAEEHNNWVNSLTGDKKEEWDRQADESAKWSKGIKAGRTERIDRFVEELSNAPINTPLTDIPGLLDGMDTMAMIKGVNRFLNSVYRGRQTGQKTAENCFAEAYNAVMADNGGKKPKLKMVLTKLSDLVDEAEQREDYSYPVDKVSTKKFEIQELEGMFFGRKAIERWHTKLNKKNFPT
ncbi:hypothetical protein [Atlantibacter hermannii]|uniref:hypothetical protein n=1 Tax=Atlantibacter hermannii TaxID=565 RepID=UPI0028AF63B2|nr:hypothetical protein [Atlantibacter hermannii]